MAGTFISKIFELEQHISYRKSVLRSTEKAFFFSETTRKNSPLDNLWSTHCSHGAE